MELSEAVYSSYILSSILLQAYLLYFQAIPFEEKEKKWKRLVSRTQGKWDYHLTRERKILGGNSKDYSFPYFHNESKGTRQTLLDSLSHMKFFAFKETENGTMHYELTSVNQNGVTTNPNSLCHSAMNVYFSLTYGCCGCCTTL